MFVCSRRGKPTGDGSRVRKGAAEQQCLEGSTPSPSAESSTWSMALAVCSESHFRFWHGLSRDPAFDASAVLPCFLRPYCALDLDHQI